jgi:hypothetical protein
LPEVCGRKPALKYARITIAHRILPHNDYTSFCPSGEETQALVILWPGLSGQLIIVHKYDKQVTVLICQLVAH